MIAAIRRGANYKLVNILLTEVETRVVGSLIEKQVTTPEYYPLTLNALMNACNQLSNRDPVVSYDEKTIARAIESLRDKKVVRMVTSADNRVPKYRQVLEEVLTLSPQEMALLCVLMLRGTQTAGELRSRTNRLYEFQDLSDIEKTLEDLSNKEVPLVIKLPRQPGQKEARYAHLLGGEIKIQEKEHIPRLDNAIIEVRAENERIIQLEKEMDQLRQELIELKVQFADFKRQFE
jgi:uncharacterized protein